MKPHECENEKLVIEAARTGRWDADLQRHIAECESCADAALAARVLNEMRASDEAEARIPHAGLMWWKAQLLAKQRAGERATQPINFVERFAYAWAALCAVGICVWQWRVIRAWLASLAGRPISLNVGSLRSFVSRACLNAIPNWPSKSVYVQGPGLIATVSVGILLVFIVFAAYLSFSEE